MNTLNSVLIEGFVQADSWKDQSGIVNFDIKTMRVDRQGQSHTPVFSVRADGRLGELVMGNLTAGRPVRVVGRLDVAKRQVFIAAEHIEFRPEAPKETRNEQVSSR